MNLDTINQKIDGWLLDEFVLPGARLHQGDLIKFEGETTPLRKAGIVVTADCDLENKKHAKLVTLVPVVTVRDLLENYLLPEDCEKKRSEIETYAFRNFGIASFQEPETMKALLAEKIATPSALGNEAAMIAAKVVTEQITSLSVSEYKSLMEAMNKTPKKAEDLTRQIGDRGDLMILPDPSKLGISGNIAWVRHIWQSSLSSIALRTSEISSKPGERIARLDSPYRYRLTQLMAQVFSDIGLPNVKHAIKEGIEEAYNYV